jgi:hypothetical protein
MNVDYEEVGSKPVAGWVCAAIGIGFVACLVFAIVGARMLGGA